MSTETKKKLYCAFVLVDENTEVKEHGAAIRYVRPDGQEETKQAPMFRLSGTTEEILEQITTRLLNGFALVEPVLARLEKNRKEEASRIIVPK